MSIVFIAKMSVKSFSRWSTVVAFSLILFFAACGEGDSASPTREAESTLADSPAVEVPATTDLASTTVPQPSASPSSVPKPTAVPLATPVLTPTAASTSPTPSPTIAEDLPLPRATPTATPMPTQIPPTPSSINTPPFNPQDQQATVEISGQAVWFAPNAAGPVRTFVPPDDMTSLFEPMAKWPIARSGVQVFKFYIEAVKKERYPLAKAVQMLNEHDIAIAVEAGGLRDTECSGNKLAQIELESLLTILKVGGRVSYLALDSPFRHTMASGSPNPCNYTTEEAAKQLLLYMKAIHRRFPEIKIGLIEPVPWYTVGNFPNHAGEYYGDLPLLLDTVLPILAEGGERLEFFHADSPFDYNERVAGGQGWAKLKALQDFVQSKNMRFGLIFNTDRQGGLSDELFFHETLLAKAKFAQAGGDPDDLILQSWYSHPREWLPEDEPYTYTYLLNKFLTMEVPTLELHVTAAARQETSQVSGFIRDKAGDPIHGALIEFWLTGLDGPGIYTKYRLSGTVPVGATKAVVGFRANIECGSGAAGKPSFTLYDVSYIEDESDTNRVPNSSFAQGLNGWGQWGTGKVTIESNDRGLGQMLQVNVTGTQTTVMNSSFFAVTDSTNYEVIFGARVSPGSVDSGCFVLIFLNPTVELSRVIIPLEPARVSYGQVTTDAEGAFQVEFHDLPEGRVLLEATSAGDQRFLPGAAEAIIED